MATIYPGTPVKFTANALGGLQPYTFNWDFGDGNTSSATLPTHAFASAGTYQIAVKVFDALQNLVQGTLQLVVSQLPPPPTISGPTTITQCTGAVKYVVSGVIAGGLADVYSGGTLLATLTADSSGSSSFTINSSNASLGTLNLSVTDRLTKLTGNLAVIVNSCAAPKITGPSSMLQCLGAQLFNLSGLTPGGLADVFDGSNVVKSGLLADASGASSFSFDPTNASPGSHTLSVTDRLSGLKGTLTTVVSACTTPAISGPTNLTQCDSPATYTVKGIVANGLADVSLGSSTVFSGLQADANGAASFTLNPASASPGAQTLGVTDRLTNLKGTLGINITAPVYYLNASISATNLTPGQAYSVQGTLLCGSTPVVGATVRIVDANGNISSSTPTTGSGAWSFNGVAPSTTGTYQVVAQYGNTQYSWTVTVSSGATGGNPMSLSGSGAQAVNVGGVPGVQITWTDNGGAGTATFYCEFLNSSGQVVDIVSQTHTFNGGDSYTPQFTYSGSWASAQLFAQDSSGNAVSPSYTVSAGGGTSSSPPPPPPPPSGLSISLSPGSPYPSWSISGLTSGAGFSVTVYASDGTQLDYYSYLANGSSDSRAFNPHDVGSVYAVVNQGGASATSNTISVSTS